MRQKDCEMSSSKGVLVILGCRAHNGIPSPALQRRLSKAWQVYLQRPELSAVIFSGLGRDPQVNEAEIMKAWWLKRLQETNLPSRARLLLESKSKTTSENATFTRELLDASSNFSQRPALVYLVTCDYHLPRALRLFKKQKLNVIGIKASSKYTRGKHLRLALRELLAELRQKVRSFLKSLKE